MREISGYLQSRGSMPITDQVLQRIATIIISHLNNALNERLGMTNFPQLNRGELVVRLREFAAGKRSKLLTKIENYLAHLVEAEEHPECLEVVERDLGDGENQEGLQKKQNNTVGGNSSRIVGVVQAAAAALIEEQSIDDNGQGCADSDELLLLENNGNPSSAEGEQSGEGQVSSFNSEVTKIKKLLNELKSHLLISSPQQRDPIWGTDEEVEMLSTNDNGDAN